jgi:hypothetical protein
LYKKALFNMWDALKQFPRLIFMSIIILFIVFSFGSAISLDYEANVARSYSFHARILMTDIFQKENVLQDSPSIYYNYFNAERLNEYIAHEISALEEEITARDPTKIPYAAKLTLIPDEKFEKVEMYFQQSLFDILKEQYVFQKAPAIVFSRSENRILIYDDRYEEAYGFLIIEVYAI